MSARRHMDKIYEPGPDNPDMVSLADEVASLVHAFGDAGRKNLVRGLARRVHGIQVRLEQSENKVQALQDAMTEADQSACITPHEPGECVVCDYCYRLHGNRKVAARAIRRALALLQLNELDDVRDELKSALVYLQGDPEEDDAGRVRR